ncbi:sensor histidine kinase [Vallitalea okinawensis]|uniref:sensor histidine kinase n=1 Tax=Vallitalea okinawensis TaxID=2078660 RepID=UPI000CFABC91|nr:HAMP domain-containing sensor histidine kinase [Vallitalea okinawensis]
MKKSISYKLFSAIFVGFILLIAVLVIALNIYFSQYYEQAKINQLINAINQFEVDYELNNWSNDELYRQLDLFSVNNNVTISVADEVNEEREEREEREKEDKNTEEEIDGIEESHNDEKAKYVLLTIVESDNNYYDLFITSEEYDNLNIQQGDWIDLEGVIGENDVITPIHMNSVVMDVNNNENIKGDIINIYAQIISVKENLTLPSKTGDEIFSIQETGSKSDVIYTISEIPHTDIRQVELRRAIRINGSDKYLYVLASLQPISETVRVLTSFYPYMLLFSLIASLILAFIHSFWVSRPIITINNAANKMAHLDFDIKLEESRSDELGQLSRSLNSMSKSLERSINELTKAKDQLQEDYDLEVRRQKAQHEFVANASHELKTPIGIIRGYAEGIRDGVGKDHTEEYVDAIVEESKKMDDLVQSMLQISKFDLLGNKLTKEDMDLEVMVFNLIQSFEHMLSDRGLLIDFSGEWGHINCEEKMMKSAIQNLMSNAIKYADDNSIIKIRSIMYDTQHKFEIENCCESFTEEDKVRVWEKFYKKDLSHNREVDGTGLGLSIVKSIIEAHELKYGVYNVNDGVVFWFSY